ncbi:hypothetical protein ACTXON_10060, partial [Brachybacterium alimentarium]|uniref:hypothetical protein n=1 Tax=Brachybacterium alimentarium TaxID=47845 RepID=UPI003FD3FF1F
EMLVRKNQNNDTRMLEWRDVVRLSAVDEETIITKRSPIESGQYQHRPVEAAIFRLFIQGDDDSGLVPIPKSAELKKISANKLEVLDRIIADLEQELADSPPLDQLRDQLARLNYSLATASDALDDVSAARDSLVAQRSENANALADLRERHDEVASLGSRFGLLRSQYDSDLSRLEMLSQVTEVLAVGEEGLAHSVGHKRNISIGMNWMPMKLTLQRSPLPSPRSGRRFLLCELNWIRQSGLSKPSVKILRCEWARLSIRIGRLQRKFGGSIGTSEFPEATWCRYLIPVPTWNGRSTLISDSRTCSLCVQVPRKLKSQRLRPKFRLSPVTSVSLTELLRRFCVSGRSLAGVRYIIQSAKETLWSINVLVERVAKVFAPYFTHSLTWRSLTTVCAATSNIPVSLSWILRS